jgi:hypothetical protein
MKLCLFQVGYYKAKNWLGVLKHWFLNGNLIFRALCIKVAQFFLTLSAGDGVPDIG